MQKEFAGRVQVLGVGFDGAEKLAGYVRDVRPGYPIGYVGRAEAVAFVEGDARDRRTLPQLVFIDRAGRVVAQYRGSSDFLQYDEDRERNVRELVGKLVGGR